MRRTTFFMVLVSVVFSSSLANGEVYVPPGLSPGDRYHLAFLTAGSTDATSSNIADYNAFVQGEAAQNPSLTGTDDGVSWYAIGSTPSVHARDNALVAAPVYRAGATG